MTSENLRIISLPADVPSNWRNFFQCVDDVFCRNPKDNIESIKQSRDKALDSQGLDQFDAVLTALALKNEANELFRQGDSRRARLLYKLSISIVPFPSTLVNLLAAQIQERRCAAAFAMDLEPIKHHFPPALMVKYLYRHAYAWLCLANEDQGLGSQTLEPMTNEGMNQAWIWAVIALTRAGKFLNEAKVIEPNNAKVVAELEIVDELVKSAGPNLQQALMAYPNSIPTPFAIQEDYDFMGSTADRLRTTYPESFDYRIEGPPPFL
ncbi:hypothetical protein C8J56DRAFT_1065988 [Mycena floridula]|nr:hypothetical protein C8J56DRAFT_1065988 [Mycena floridula]